MGASFGWTQVIQVSTNTLGIMDEEKTDLTIPQIWWNYRLRAVGAELFQNPFFRLWPTSKFMSGDPVNGVPYLTGLDGVDGAAYEPWSVFAGGAFRPGYLMGQCTLSDGVTALAAATVDLFLTATNQLVANGVTDQNGYYMLPTPFLAQTHYIYANYSNGTYVGASINTLIPNF